MLPQQQQLPSSGVVTTSTILGTIPRDSRPKDLRLINGTTTTTTTTTLPATITSSQIINQQQLMKNDDDDLNGLAIKERLMANRLPESCV